MKRNIFIDRLAGWLVIFVFLLGASVALRSQTALINFFSIDDAYYYFQTARNFVNGHGISFDGIARANGYHPLWMLVCFPVFAFANLNIWLPLRMLVVIQSALHAASGLFLFKTLRLHLSKLVSLVVMSLWLFSVSIYRVSGMTGLETGINAFFMILLFYAAVRYELGQPLKLGGITGLWLVGILAALTLLSRLDNIFLVGFIGIWLVLKQTNLNRYLVVTDIFLATGMVIFSHLFLFRFSNTYFNLLPAIKFMAVFAAVTHPMSLLILGADTNDQFTTNKPWFTLLKWLGGTLFASAILYVGVALRFPQGGYSRAAMLLHGALFIFSALGIRLILYLFQRQANQEHEHKEGSFTIIKTLTWKPLTQNVLAYFLPLAGSLGGFLLFNRIYFGAMMPLSGKIKEWWGGMDTVYGVRARNYATFLGLQRQGPFHYFMDSMHDLADILNRYLPLARNQVFFTLLFLLILFTAVVILRKKTSRSHLAKFLLVPLAIAIAFHIGYYMMTGYIGYRRWYWLSETLLLLLLLGLLITAITAEWEKKIPLKHIMHGSAALLILLLLVSFNIWHLRVFPINQPTSADPLWYVRELEKLTEEGSLIGMTGGGDTGYFIEGRTIINLDGLINGVEYYDHLQNFTANQYLSRIGLDYIFGKPFMLFESDPYQHIFQELLSPVAVIGDITLYRYLP